MKAKKALAITLSAALAGLVSLSLCGCDWFSSGAGGAGSVDGGKKNPYEVATDLGYGGNVGEWLSGAVSPDSEARRMYEEAREDGYEGTFLDLEHVDGRFALDCPSGNLRREHYERVYRIQHEHAAHGVGDLRGRGRGVFAR